MKGIRTLLLLFLSTTVLHAQQKKIMVMEIKSEIDPRTARYVELALDNAKRIKAEIVLIEMDTYGGVLTDAKDIVDMLMSFKPPVWVFIDKDAASAGALISIACDSIYMAPGATIGAATVVTAAGEKAPDKYQSYMRSIMRSTAEENGRDPRIAEGMVDEGIVIEGVKKEGEVLTFSTTEALEHGFCDAKVESDEEIFERNHVGDYEVIRFELSATNQVVAFFLNPFISGILILIILGGLYFELQTPGVGFPLIAAVTALVLYLVPYYLNGLAENWEVLALLGGLVLIVLEIFVIPGFGVAGILGITMTVSSLILIMVNNDAFDFNFVPSGDLILAVAATFGGLLGGMVVMFLGGARISNMKFFKRVALVASQERSEGYTSSFHKLMTGKKGVAYTVLRPSGKVMIDGQLYDAFTRGDYIEKGQSVEVIDEDTNSLQVKMAHS